VDLYQFFLLSPLQCTVTHYRNCKRLDEFEEIEIAMQSREVTLNSKVENSLRLLSGFCPRIRPLDGCPTHFPPYRLLSINLVVTKLANLQTTTGSVKVPDPNFIYSIIQ
jgi:hypothetical protein